ncbi:MAG TPA: TatD family hydrolase [Candidatus Edwardsbacteria bacterium]|nr:TatD family hydrolase [Candidatus Edwardsbacteria bacterium]
MLGYIDCHLHLDPTGKFQRDEFATPVPNLPEDLLAAMDERGIERGVVAAARPQDNDHVLACQRRHPARLYAAVCLHPNDAGAPAKFREYVSTGAQGLVLDPLAQEFDDMESGRLAPLVQEAGILNVHVQFDCRPALGFSTVAGATRMAYEFPETKFILLHAAAQRFADLLPVANDIGSRTWKNFYVDLSETIVLLRFSPFWEQFRWTMHQLGARHLVFGSGHPRGDLAKTLEAAHDLGFSAEEESLIFRENMAGILDRRG